MSKRIPASIKSTLCRVCFDRAGIHRCPICQEKHCEEEDCAKPCGTCSDCYHKNCPDCGTYVDPIAQIKRNIKGLEFQIKFKITQLKDLEEQKRLLGFRLESKLRRLEMLEKS